jgi:hypothetical protein
LQKQFSTKYPKPKLTSLLSSFLASIPFYTGQRFFSILQQKNLMIVDAKQQAALHTTHQN